MLKRLACLLLLVLFLASPVEQAAAQDQQPAGPVYVVQSGDTYYSIAIKFGVTVDEITAVNPNVDPTMLTVGSEVVIPGLEGMRGRLETQVIQLGESMRTLSIRNQVPLNQVIKLNHITSPAEVFAGTSLIVPQDEAVTPLQSHYQLGEGQSLFQLAVRQKLNPWLVAEMNHLSNTWDLLPGEVLYDKPIEGQSSDQVSLISPIIRELVINPLPIQQGETTVIRVNTTQPIELSGSLAGRNLNFFPDPDQPGANAYVALQGVHVMSEPGIYPFTLQGKLADGSLFSFEQMVILQALGYVNEKIDGVDPSTIDPAVTKPEEDKFKEIISKITPEKYWSGVWTSPGYDPTWITSTFGNRRSYNGGPYSYFHTGIDYGGGTGLEIKAPAAGVVVFAEFLTVRGNAMIIDHGWGVYSGFWHQSEFRAKVGDRIEPGQVIGLIGGTGRITGPHLHWEVLVNGVHVDPYTWLNKTFP